jgi:hypothetical protein
MHPCHPVIRTRVCHTVLKEPVGACIREIPSRVIRCDGVPAPSRHRHTEILDVRCTGGEVDAVDEGRDGEVDLLDEAR